MKVRKAVIPAAGLGTRFLPASKAVPKEMLPLVDKPIIQYIVEEAVASGIQDIILVSSQPKRALEDHFDYAFELEQRLQAAGKMSERDEVRRIADLAHFIFVRQREPLGNGHAVLMAKEAVGDEPFAVLWGDDVVIGDPPCLRQLIDVYERFGASVLAVMSVPEEDVSKYGIVQAQKVEDRLHRVFDIVEKPRPEEAPSRLAAVKGYVLTPTVMSILERTPPGKGGEIWLVDALRELARSERLYAWEFVGRRYDAGDKLDYLRATLDLALSRPEFREPLLKHIRALGIG